MRFNATEPLSGCLKLTLAAAPMLKLCQSSAARALVCCTVSAFALWLMLALPAVTLPPLGRALRSSAYAGAPMRARQRTRRGCRAKARPTHARVSPARERPVGERRRAEARPTVWLLPRPRAISATATQARLSSFQTRR